MRRGALAALYWGATAAFALPLSLIALTSLSGGEIVGFPLGPPSLRWYGMATTDPDVRSALALSMAMAATTALLSLLAGTWIALTVAALRPAWIRGVLLACALLPLVTPGIVHAIALRIAIHAIGLDPGAGAILLGHVIHATPYVAIMAGTRLATMPDGLVDAARTLGAGPAASFAWVVVPWLAPALLGAGALAALSSFDDFIRSFFLGGYDSTLPVLIFGRLRSGLTPEINAIATLALLLVGMVVALLEWTRRRAAQAASGAEERI
jgi:spermidine/putrescine transport system permease protein